MGNSEDLWIFLEDLFDYLNSQEAGIAKLKRQIEKLIGSSLEWTWNPDAIKWSQVEGFKGKYERYPALERKAEATEDYKRMLVDLKAHGGRLSRDGYFYWVFEDMATVGRKRLEAESR